MAIIFEDSAKVTNKKIPIPKEDKKVFQAMEKVYEPYLDKNVAGSKVLKSLARKTKGYNAKTPETASGKGEEMEQDYISVDDAKVRLHRMNSMNPNDVRWSLYGAERGEKLYRDGIRRARGVKEVDAVKPPKPTSNAVKPSSVGTKEVDTPNGKITYSVTKEGTEHGGKKIYITESQIMSLNDGKHTKGQGKHSSGRG